MNNKIMKEVSVITDETIISKLSISIEDAIDFIECNWCLKEDYGSKMYQKNSFEYTFLAFENYKYACVKINNRYAWYIVVNEGMFSAKIYNKKDNTNYKNADGILTSMNNINCIIYADNMEYIFIGEDIDNIIDNNMLIEYNGCI